MSLTFDDKLMALATIRAIGVRRATLIFARAHRVSPPNMREILDALDRTHYLLDAGVVVVTTAGVLQYIEFTCPQQPHLLTTEYFYEATAALQEEFNEAFAVLRCTGLCRGLKPLPIVAKEPRYAKKANAAPPVTATL